MTYKEARELAKRIQSDGPYCIVPRGQDYRPDNYCCRIFPSSATDPNGHLDLWTWEEWTERRDRQNLDRERAIAALERRLHQIRSRSPIEMMIDRACGIE